MYLPKSKYRVKNPPPGTFVTEAGTEHRGPVVELNTGEVYAGDSITNLGSRLVDPSLETAPVEVPQPFNEYIKPTPEDYSRGKFIRYLLRNQETKRVVETSRKQFDQKRNLPNIQPIEVEWLLTGAIEDRTVGTNVVNGEIRLIKVKGVRTRNLETVQELEQAFRGISLFLDDPLKFVK